jgi:predicted amidohydrolase
VIVAGLQSDTAWMDPPANFRRAEALLERARSGGARLVALPEMFATGFTMDAERAAAAAGPTVAFLRDAAQRHGLYVLAGYAAPANGRPVNRASLFGPDGEELLRYDKLHPFSFAGEHERYAPGAALPTVTVAGIRLTVLICYDLRFPEPFRAAAADTDLFAVVANWPVARKAHWRALLTARAIEEQAYVLGVNRVGSGDGLDYEGDSMLLDPLGGLVETLGDTVGVVAGPVEAARVAEVRARFGFLGDRRPEAYRELERERGLAPAAEPV